METRTLQELNLLDNFLFEEALNQGENSIEFCRILLSTILEKDFKNITITPQRNVSGTSPGKRGIRMDAYIEADEYIDSLDDLLSNADIEINSGIYNIEPNKYKASSEAKRTRYYHSLIDSKILKSGVDYSKLKQVVVIMILPYDPFGMNRMVYTIKNSCIEDPSIPYDDGIITIYLYTKGTEGNPSQNLKNLLKYIEETTTENATNSNLKAIHNMVTQIKASEEVGVRYMQSWEYEAYIRQESLEEGKAIGLQEGKSIGLQEGAQKKAFEIAKSLLDVLDPATIALKTGLPEEEILGLLQK